MLKITALSPSLHILHLQKILYLQAIQATIDCQRHRRANPLVDRYNSAAVDPTASDTAHSPTRADRPRTHILSSHAKRIENDSSAKRANVS